MTTPPEATPFVPLGELTHEATAFDCPLCGAKFSHGQLVCGSCPLHAGCDIIKCPSCGYQFPRRSQVIDFARRLFGSRSRG